MDGGRDGWMDGEMMGGELRSRRDEMMFGVPSLLSTLWGHIL